MNRVRIGNFLPTNPDTQNLLNRIVTNLLFLAKDKKSFAVTSCHDGEGKSTLAVQIAYTLTREGYKVIIIDTVPKSFTPFEYDTQEHYADNKKSLSDYLAGKSNLSDLLYASEVRDLCLFPLKNYVSDVSVPTNPKLFSDLLDSLADSCDFIIVDTPSAGQMIDAAMIAKACDGIVLVVKYKSTKKKDTLEVVRQLEKSGTPILGCVINKVKFDSIISRKRYRFLRIPFSKRKTQRKNR